nr:hypothetical protein [Tanacetum cinerariifolium]
MAFVSSPSTNSTNEVHTTYRVSTASTQSSTASTQVSTASLQTSTANLSDASVYAFLANKSNGSRLVHEDLEQIHEDDLEEMDLKWQLALLSMRAKSLEELFTQQEKMELETTQTSISAKLPMLKRAEGGAITTTISSPVTTKEKIKKKNDVKAISMLLMALPNEHLMTFNQYKDAKSLFAAIETRFG